MQSMLPLNDQSIDTLPDEVGCVATSQRCDRVVLLFDEHPHSVYGMLSQPSTHDAHIATIDHAVPRGAAERGPKVPAVRLVDLFRVLGQLTTQPHVPPSDVTAEALQPYRTVLLEHELGPVLVLGVVQQVLSRIDVVTVFPVTLFVLREYLLFQSSPEAFGPTAPLPGRQDPVDRVHLVL